MRRDFRLPEADEQHLNGWGLPWETIVDGKQRWLLVHDWPLPSGYNYSTVTVALLIPTAYPEAALDMVYFHPHLQRQDGKQIRALSSQTIAGESWQRWSRHYSSENPWRIGEDDVSTHLTLVDYWLKREMEK